MKKTVLISVFALGFMSLFAQTNTPQPSTEVAPCNGKNNTKPLNIGEKSIMFNQAGINLNKYDWSNLNINCHINETLTRYKTSKSLKSVAWILAGGGAGFLVGGIMSAGSGRGSGSDGGAGAMIAVGAVSLVGSIPLFIGGSNNKKKSDYHMQQVMEFYRQKGW